MRTDTATGGGDVKIIKTVLGAGATAFFGGDGHKYWKTFSCDIATVDSLSKNYIDVYFTRQKSYDDLSIEEKRKLILEELLIERIVKQIDFGDKVKIGDKVFSIKFKHKEKPYEEKLYSNLNYLQFGNY